MTLYRDPQVTVLRHKLAIEEHMAYTNPPPVEFETTEARFKLNKDTLTCELKLPFPDVQSARSAVEAVIEAWEAAADLRGTRGQLRFRYEEAELIDRDPAPAGESPNKGAVLLPSLVVASQGSVGKGLSWDSYPTPPSGFRLTPDADTLLRRYRRYLDGKELLLSMAYFCLTVVEAAYNPPKRRSKAARGLNIDEAVLDKIGELTGETRGDTTTARKAGGASQVPLSAKEQQWLEAAVKMLIFRLGNTSGSSSLPVITMADLPRL